MSIIILWLLRKMLNCQCLPTKTNSCIFTTSIVGHRNKCDTDGIPPQEPSFPILSHLCGLQGILFFLTSFMHLLQPCETVWSFWNDMLWRKIRPGQRHTCPCILYVKYSLCIPYGSLITTLIHFIVLIYHNSQQAFCSMSSTLLIESPLLIWKHKSINLSHPTQCQ